MSFLSSDKYKCPDCGKIMDEDELEVYEEPSEAWGHTVYEKFWLCPDCGGTPEEYYGDDEEEEEEYEERIQNLRETNKLVV